ncbi:MAG: type II secretion system protein [Pedobacter sp.]|uniref:type II secretion system protein n=1 Tax=Pedobacter sp. TaxID=1411316 RepID=UPI003564031E
MNSKKGFTLIELLIVIAIIAVLAVAFSPTILGAPAKGRDTARVAALQKIQKVVVSANLDGKSYPSTGCVTTGFGGATDSAYYLAALGGALPVDPQTDNVLPTVTCKGQYYFKMNPDSPATNYKFGVYAHAENASTNTFSCADAYTGKLTLNSTAGTDLCFAVLTQ